MILIIAGSSDSYQIISALKEKQKRIIASVTTDYGQELIKEKFEIPVIKKRMDTKALIDLIESQKITRIIDATHPFADKISKNAITAAQKTEISYLRFERQELKLDLKLITQTKIIRAASYQEAAFKAKEFEKIFLTTGSKNINVFMNEITNYKQRLFLRIMAFPDFIKKILAAGISPANLIAAKGPFSKEFNQAMFKEYQADVIITKASGETGGLKTKIEAAAALGLTVILIERPKIKYPKVFNNVNNLIEYIID
jgi:precorrin-6A/cobalt-precorrin-6A reductase